MPLPQWIQNLTGSVELGGVVSGDIDGVIDGSARTRGAIEVVDFDGVISDVAWDVSAIVDLLARRVSSSIATVDVTGSIGSMEA